MSYPARAEGLVNSTYQKFDYLVKLNKGEKKDKYLIFPRETKRVWDMKMSVIPILVAALGTFPNGLLKRLEDLEHRGQVETIKTTEILRSEEILRIFREYETQKVLWDFEIQTDYLISARWPDLVIVNKKREPAE